MFLEFWYRFSKFNRLRFSSIAKFKIVAISVLATRKTSVRIEYHCFRSFTILASCLSSASDKVVKYIPTEPKQTPAICPDIAITPLTRVECTGKDSSIPKSMHVGRKLTAQAPQMAIAHKNPRIELLLSLIKTSAHQNVKASRQLSVRKIKRYLLVIPTMLQIIGAQIIPLANSTAPNKAIFAVSNPNGPKIDPSKLPKVEKTPI